MTQTATIIGSTSKAQFILFRRFKRPLIARYYIILGKHVGSTTLGHVVVSIKAPSRLGLLKKVSKMPILKKLIQAKLGGIHRSKCVQLSFKDIHNYYCHTSSEAAQIA